MTNFFVAIGALIAGAIAVWFGGRSSAKQDADKGTIDTVNTAKGVQNEIDSLDNSAIRDRANDWLRGPGKK